MKEQDQANGEFVGKAELFAVSQEAFGQVSYGQLAADMIDKLEAQAWVTAEFELRTSIWEGNTLVSDDGPARLRANGLDHNPWTQHIHYLNLFEGRAAQTATGEQIEEALRAAIADKPLYFDYGFLQIPDRRWRPNGNIAMLVPGALTKEALRRYLTSDRHAIDPDYSDRYPADYRIPRLSEHELRGALGRALDILLFVAGLQDDIDPAKTAASGELMNLDDFRKNYLKYFTSPTARRNFLATLRRLARDQAEDGRLHDKFEVVTEGNVRLHLNWPAITIESVTIDTLREYGQHRGGKAMRDTLTKL